MVLDDRWSMKKVGFVPSMPKEGWIVPRWVWIEDEPRWVIEDERLQRMLPTVKKNEEAFGYDECRRAWRSGSAWRSMLTIDTSSEGLGHVLPMNVVRHFKSIVVVSFTHPLRTTLITNRKCTGTRRCSKCRRHGIHKAPKHISIGITIVKSGTFVEFHWMLLPKCISEITIVINHCFFKTLSIGIL